MDLNIIKNISPRDNKIRKKEKVMGLVYATSSLQEDVLKNVKDNGYTLAQAMREVAAMLKFREEDNMRSVLDSYKYVGDTCKMKLPQMITDAFSKEGVTVGSVEASLVKAGYPKEYVALYIVDYLKNQYLV